MTTVLAAGDTWGVSGPRFLQMFLILGVGGLLLALVWRRAALRGADLATLRPPNPAELAYLNGGPRLALSTSVAGLRCTGAVGAGPARGTVVAVGPMPGGFSDLDYAVHRALGTPVSLHRIEGDAGVANALRRVADRLTSDGLLLSPGQRGIARSASVVVFAVTALGIARIVAGVANHKPVGYLVFATVIAIVVALRLLSAPKVSRAGRTLLARLRSGNAHLRPGLSPSWATYGAAGAMLGVALYGTAAL
jgi:uncharacterized protein (TIGR04222 family)